MTRTTDSLARAPRTVACLLVPALAAALVLAACGGSSPSTAAPTAKVTATWTTFFKGSTPASKKVELLQDGTALASTIRQAFASSFAKSVSVKVTKVTVHGSTAAVTYTIDVGGVPTLPGQTGQAVQVGGTWKVSTQSVCGLLALEHLTPTVCAT